VSPLCAHALSGLPEVRAGDELAELIVSAMLAESPARSLRDEHVVVIAHKVVSKAEGAVVALSDVHPGERARELAAEAIDPARRPGRAR